MIELVEWLALVATLPTDNKAARMRLWRAIKARGCAALRDGAYLLPASNETCDALLVLAADVRAAGGNAEVLHIAASGAQDANFRNLFDRGAEYAELLARIAQLGPAATARELRGLRRSFEVIAAIDYFPGEARRQAEVALAEVAAQACGEPRPVAGTIRRLASADFQGRTWATRRHLWVDRMASAWLIRRFIDPQARFLWLASPADVPPDVLGFDYDGAAFTHVDGRVSFEVLLESFGLADDAALARLGALVHFLDVGGVQVAEAAGIEAVLGGARTTASDDDVLLAEASRVFDNLYNNYRQENAHD